MSYTILKTPGGEELVIVPLADFNRMQDLLDAAEHGRVMQECRAGQQDFLTDDEVLQSMAEPTPLAFWRKKRGFTQQQLGAAAGVSQQFLAQLETGKRKGDPFLFRKLAEALRVRMEDLVSD